MGMLGNIYLAIFATIFISFFFLKDKFLLRKITFSIINNDKHEKAKNALINAKYLLSRYFIGILIQISCVTFLVTMGLTFLGVENAIVIGFFAGLTNIIPYLGPMIGSFVGLTLSVITNLNLAPELLLPFAVKIMFLFMLTQIIDNMILQPTIFSRSVKAHPLEIFSIVMIGFQLGGLIGMIIAIPFYTLFRIFAKEFLSEFEFIQNITKNI
jgi:predicted PurR-regulated permease PerM